MFVPERVAIWVTTETSHVDIANMLTAFASKVDSERAAALEELITLLGINRESFRADCLKFNIALWNSSSQCIYTTEIKNDYCVDIIAQFPTRRLVMASIYAGKYITQGALTAIAAVVTGIFFAILYKMFRGNSA